MGSDRKLIVLLVVLLGALFYGMSGGHTTFAADGTDPDWDDAVNSRDTSKPTVVFFTASWCPHCQELFNDVLDHSEVQDYLAHHYNFHVVEITTPRGGIRARKFNINAYPTLIRYDTAGHETSRYHNGTEEQIIAWLKDGEE